ncbi:hypothetical protein PHMEG_00024064 [Phytophthora megakarya]|uniref:Uncharacterized protein n=1 Tax=Phytophthora megakarya TaxID=4795 RepID=A0A225VG50_9STRA|nr:hypothetical protein PHMEG_00024064 [Phytophthora megakarya]
MTTRWVAVAIKTQYDVATDSSVTISYAFKDNYCAACQPRVFARAGRMATRCGLQEDVWKHFHHPVLVDFFMIVRANSVLEGRRFRCPSTICCQDIQMGPHSTGCAMAAADKHRRAQHAFARISGVLAQLKDAGFESAMGYWWYNLRNRVPPPEATAEEDRGPDDSNGGEEGAGGGISADAETKDNDHDDDAQHEDNLFHENSDKKPPTQPASTSTQDAGNSDHTPNVRLTGNIRRVGRPHLNRANQKEKARQRLKSTIQG